jgi:DNA-binding XRE family transcriptional regulator
MLVLNNIKEIREDELNFSLEQMAELTGVPKTTLWKIENGVTYPSHKLILKICKGINRKIDKEIYEIFNFDWKHIHIEWL